MSAREGKPLQNQNYLGEVRRQYEALPYPHRNPEDEKRRLVPTWLDDLAMINHYCFAGRQSFGDGFRALVAGGGTGDATIFLTQQLSGTNAKIFHLDMSEASIAIARRRAEARSLTNITWVHDSLLELPALDVGQFDYIQCSGVLHHLADPDAGLQALASVLKPGGALGIMVYGLYGRTGVYQLQTLLRLMKQEGAGLRESVSCAKEVLGHLPATNWFLRGEDLYVDHRQGDAGIYDLLLHSQDRAYTVGEVYDWFADQHGYKITFTDVERGPAAYDPAQVLSPKWPGFLDDIKAKPLRRRQEIAELLTGSIIRHTFYASRSENAEAPYGDADYVPFLFHEPVTGPDLARIVEQNRKPKLTLNHTHTGFSFEFPPGRYAKYILNHIDGIRCFGEIFDVVRAIPKFAAEPPDNAALFEDFRHFYDTLRSIDRILLRHRSICLPT